MKYIYTDCGLNNILISASVKMPQHNPTVRKQDTEQSLTHPKQKKGHPCLSCIDIDMECQSDTRRVFPGFVWWSKHHTASKLLCYDVSCHQYEISGVLCYYVWGSPHSGEMFEEEPLDEAPIYRGLFISYTRDRELFPYIHGHGISAWLTRCLSGLPRFAESVCGE